MRPQRRRISALLALILMMGLAGTAMVQTAGASTPNAVATLRQAKVTGSTVSVSTVAGSAVVAPDSVPRTWGATTSRMPWDPTALDDLSVTAGHDAQVAMWYVAWSSDSPFPAADASRVASRGATPEITWEPWDPRGGVNQPTYSLADIAAGNFDSYLTSWAQAVEAWGQPIRIRLAQEMNGNWYPWAQGVNGNRPGSFVAAWRHVVALFRAVGATNVTWVWSPNVPFSGSASLASVFPGDEWLDEADLDGYNWAGMQGGRWTSFAEVFGKGVSRLSRLSTRPLGIGEVGCPEAGGSKEAWIHGMWHTLASWQRVRTLVWFDYDKEADWRINSSNESAAAFRQGVSSFVAS